MNYLTAEQILFIHSRLIDETGGGHGIRDVGLLISAVSRPQATFDNEDLYPDLFAKAAALMESLIFNPPFVDGNKRAAITTTILFLQQNGRLLTATNNELEKFTLNIVRQRPSLAEIAHWLRLHTVN